MNFRVVRAVAKATFVEFWRTPAAVFWTYGFPLLMIIGLGLALRPTALEPAPVAVVAGDIGDDFTALLRRSEDVALTEMSSAAAERALLRGQVDLIVRGTIEAPVLRADPTRAEALRARLQVERALRRARDGAGPEIVIEPEDRPGARYIDFLVPGLIGLNLMGACMWGIGFNLVMMRMQNLLRRLFVTPMRRGDFLLGYMIGRGVLVVPESMIIALLGMWIWDVPFRGSWLAMVVVVIAGGLAFTGLGCLCAARARTFEGISGLMNACQLPMWGLAGVFFDNSDFTGVVRWLAEILPLTHVVRAFRDLMLEPAGFAAVAWPLVGLLVFGTVSFGLALRLFKWD